MSKHPRYLDLPTYDALRELGSDYEAWATIDVGKRVLVLCSYAKELFGNWEFVRSRLNRSLSEKKNVSPQIERIIDYGTPQLIWQSLYEQIRRTAACVVDWTGYSSSVFLELGVRLAVSEWGAIQIVDENYLPGKEKAPKLTQVAKMRHFFNPIIYRRQAGFSDAMEKVAEVLLQRDPHLDKDPDYNRIHRALLPVIGTVQEKHLPVAEDLKKRADALHHPQQERVAVPQILFHGSRVTKQDSEKAALELRIAAWLYLEHRVQSPKMKENENAAMRELYRDLGRSAIDALYDIGDEESIEFAEYIEDRLKQRE